jgi:hypothetical protein
LSNDTIVPKLDNLSINELDQTLEDAVVEHERSEQLICFALLEMNERKGYQKFGFFHITDYARARFDFSDRKTYYLLHLARKVKEHPKIEQALAEGKLGWAKAYRIVRLASAEDEVMSLESAMSLSVRELDRRIRKKLDDVTTKLSLWLKEDQHSIWEYALEVCRRVSGANLSPEQCLEYMAGEFLATWAFEANREDELSDESSESRSANSEEQTGLFEPDTLESSITEEDSSDLQGELERLCPESKDLPSASVVPYSRIARAVLERDGWQCCYPECSARSKLHVHHVEHRSHFGKKRQQECHSLCNLTTICAFHHRLLHAGIIGVEGIAPFELEWHRPKLMEAVMLKLERKRAVSERKERQSKPQEPLESSCGGHNDLLHTCAEDRLPQQAVQSGIRGEEVIESTNQDRSFASESVLVAGASP